MGKKKAHTIYYKPFSVLEVKGHLSLLPLLKKLAIIESYDWGTDWGTSIGGELFKIEFTAVRDDEDVQDSI